jgi:hypothetical protein
MHSCVLSVVVAAFAAAGALAETTSFSELGRVFVSEGAAFATSTRSVAAYPLDEEPMFWVDACERENWQFDDKGKILVIPSKSPSSRYLTAEIDKIAYTNYEGNLWYSSIGANIKLQRPAVATDSSINGPFIDFGESGSRTALFFDPIVSGEGATPTNILTGIGTVVGVYRSKNGAGNFLGGNMFRRYTDYWGLQGTNYSEQIVAGGNGNSQITGGMLWSGLQKSAPSTSYWSGNWQVMALNPTEATIVSDGLCGNPYYQNEFVSSGGQSIAELMIFDRVLEDRDITNLVVYLERKWFGVSPAGFNGEAEISWLEIGGKKPPHGQDAANYPCAGVEVPVEVKPGDRLTINRLTGGRSTKDSKHRLVKTGDGELRLCDAGNFGGTVALEEGTLVLGGKKIPEFGELAPALCLHFDPSEESSMTLENGKVSVINNLGNSGKYSVTGKQASEALRPELITDAPRAGLNLIDFNRFTAGEGKYIQFETAAAPQIGTLVMVVDSSTYTGAHFMNGMFTQRTTESSRFFTYDYWNGSKALFLTPNSVYINGYHANMSPLESAGVWANARKLTHLDEGYETPGLNVIALRVPAAAIHGFGGFGAGVCGGLRIGEILAWKSELTDGEILDAQAYLMEKWLKRTASGYAPKTESAIADLQEVVASEGTRIHVGEGKKAYLSHLAALGKVEKTGAGTLYIERTTDTAERLFVKEGEVQLGAGGDVGSASEVAKLPALHFDPSQSWSIRTSMNNGTNFVWTMLDMSGLVSATESFQDWSLNRPFLDGSECNGLATLNFGELFPGYTTGGAYLKLSRNMTNVRSLYFVLGSQEGGGNPIGCCNASSITLGDSEMGGRRLDFYRGYTGSKETMRSSALFKSSAEAVRTGELYVNGERCESVVSYVPNGGYELVELHLDSGCQFNGLGSGFESYIRGGFRLGEMLVYERPLTEREKTATRNHLMKKWFAAEDDELAPLPEKPAAQPIGICRDRFTVDFGASGEEFPDAVIGIAAGATFEIKNLPQTPSGQMATVATAADFAGAANLGSAVLAGVAVPNGGKIKFKVEDGVLYARYIPVGLTVLVR